jgi:hypothetical protein
MHMNIKRWQDWGNLLLGAWLFVSPWALGYANELSGAAWNAYILGAAIVLFAAVAVYMPKAWEEAVNGVLGAWLIVSPWALGFASHRSAMLNAVIVGAVVMLLAIWAMARDQDVRKWWHDHHRPAV